MVECYLTYFQIIKRINRDSLDHNHSFVDLDQLIGNGRPLIDLSLFYSLTKHPSAELSILTYKCEVFDCPYLCESESGNAKEAWQRMTSHIARHFAISIHLCSLCKQHFNESNSLQK